MVFDVTTFTAFFIREDFIKKLYEFKSSAADSNDPNLESDSKTVRPYLVGLELQKGFHPHIPRAKSPLPIPRLASRLAFLWRPHRREVGFGGPQQDAGMHRRTTAVQQILRGIACHAGRRLDVAAPG